ncbi:MAG: phage major capsid protein [Pirellulaceae bacterium]|nr:phage major capsid protein [Pirellulaceae bacterium]
MPQVLRDRRLDQLERRVADARQMIATLHRVAAGEGRALTEKENGQLEEYLSMKTAAQADVDAYRRQLELDYSEPPIWSEELPGNHHYPPRPVDTSGMGKGEAWATKLFGGAPRASSGFASLEEYFQVVRAGKWDDRLQGVMVSGQKSGSGSAGGFLVPEEFVFSALGPAYESSIVLQRAEVVPMQAESRTVAGWDSSSASGGTLFGGFAPQWLGEGDQLDIQTAQARKIKLVPKKVALLGKTSNEILDDATALPEFMTSGMGTALGFTIDFACLHGTGAGQPLGAFNCGSKVQVGKEAAQAANSIVYSNILKMQSRLHPALWNDAVWMAHPSTIPWLFRMTVDVGTAGSFIPVLTSRDGQAEMLYRPIIWTEKCNPLGTEGDIVLVAWSEYYIGLRKEISIEQSQHVYFTTDETAWRGVARIDGQPRWSTPYTPAKGSDSFSWCVTLESR